MRMCMPHQCHTRDRKETQGLTIFLPEVSTVAKQGLLQHNALRKGHSQALSVFWLKPSSDVARLFTLASQEQPWPMNERAAEQHLQHKPTVKIL